MRKRVLAVLTAGFLAFAPAAFASPPDGDPSGGDGENGSAGCQGVAHAEEQVKENTDAADDAFDLVNAILTGDDGECEGSPGDSGDENRP